LNAQTCLLGEPLVNHSQSQDCEKDWMTHAVTWRSSIVEFLITFDRNGLSGKMSPVSCQAGGGRDFGSFLGAVAQLGYGFAYRVLDAQWFGVAQRRRRVFVVGYFGDWRPAAAVLFEHQSLRRNTAPSREKGQTIAPTVVSGPPFSRTENERVECDAIVATVAAFKGGQGSGAGGIGYSEHVAPTLPASDGGNRTPTLLNGMAVRRLTPVECERLQGFPDNYTEIPWRGKTETPDGPRYKALGNSMAVPVMKWIGEGIDDVNSLG
jgi:DNA (cytosine-5)-methyltransferase 1